jgi:hypothetical protein
MINLNSSTDRAYGPRMTATFGYDGEKLMPMCFGGQANWRTDLS